jgi:hypothetical protein
MDIKNSAKLGIEHAEYSKSGKKIFLAGLYLYTEQRKKPLEV